MKKMILAGFLLGTLLLTGCGENGLIQQYANLDDIKMLDTEQELKAAQREIKPADQGKWSYRTEKIQEVIDLTEKVKEICKDDKVKVEAYNEDGDRASARLWAEHARKGMDPQKEKQKGLTIELSMQDKETAIDACKKLAEFGFTNLQDYSGSVEFKTIQNGYAITVEEGVEDYDDEDYDDEDYDDEDYDDEADEEDGHYIEDEDAYWQYSISIQVPDVKVFGPERYFDIVDTCMENGWFVERLICEGGAIDGMVLNNYFCEGVSYADGSYINVNVLLKDDKVLEIVAFHDEWKGGNFFTEAGQKGMAELITRMCGDRNEAISLLKGLSSSGSRRGSIGDHTWTIEKNVSRLADSYLFRIQ